MITSEHRVTGELIESEPAAVAADYRAEAAPFRQELKQVAHEVRNWPLSVQIFALSLMVLFTPVLIETAALWLKDDSFAHGVFIFPVAAFLIWMSRDAARRAPARPTAWGLFPLALGLAAETVGYLARVRFLAMAAIVPTLAGALLLCGGRDKWRIVRFPILFLLFSAPIPGFLLAAPMHWIQNVSSIGAASIMKLLGYPLVQTGNIIEIPGMALEVADICSGFKKLFALLAFSLLYAYVFDVPVWKKALLVLSAVPIAVVANVTRVAGLIALSSAGGHHALNLAHDWAELFVIVVAFVLFTLVGKGLGCKTLRFCPSAGSS